MSLGNVTSARVHDRYFQQAMAYLREAAEMPDYSLPPHLEQHVTLQAQVMTRMLINAGISMSMGHSTHRLKWSQALCRMQAFTSSVIPRIVALMNICRTQAFSLTNPCLCNQKTIFFQVEIYSTSVVDSEARYISSCVDTVHHQVGHRDLPRRYH